MEAFSIILGQVVPENANKSPTEEVQACSEALSDPTDQATSSNLELQSTPHTMSISTGFETALENTASSSMKACTKLDSRNFLRK